MTVRAFPPFARRGTTPFEIEAASRFDAILAGKLNVVLDVTLATSAASTVVKDPRISEQSWLWLMPTTANAAAELGAGGIYISARTAGQATITHANNAQTDRDFTLLIIG